MSNHPQCTAKYTRRERNPDAPNQHHHLDAYCKREQGHLGDHWSLDPFDLTVSLYWTDGGLAALGSADESPVVLKPNGTRPEPDEPNTERELAAVENTGEAATIAPASIAAASIAPVGEEPDLAVELVAITDALHRHVIHLREELQRERRLRADAEEQLRELQTERSAA